MHDDNHAWTEDDLSFEKSFVISGFDEIKEIRWNAEYYAWIGKRIHARITEDPIEYEKLLKRLEELRFPKFESPVTSAHFCATFYQLGTVLQKQKHQVIAWCFDLPR